MRVEESAQLKENGVCMQPKSHDAYKRDRASRASDQWIEQARIRSDVYEEAEDQWAVLRHEVEGEALQRHEERLRTDWEERDTDGTAFSSVSPFDTFADTHHADIAVVGVGGGGMNAINRMIDARVRGVRFVAMNTDAQVLALSQAPDIISLGQQHTRGLGAGGNAAVGMRAATESGEEIRAALGNADMVFIAAGMGGGTGTGAAPVVASIAKKLGALTVGIVTLPFSFEGSRRRRIAEQGLNELSNEVDALITVPNDRLLNSGTRERSLTEAFKVADDVLRQGVQGIAEVINVPGMINVDFADVRSVLREAGTALMSIGQGKGRNRAQMAAEEAVAGGFLNVTIRGARRVLFNISGGEDMTLHEINEVAERIGAAIDDAADIIFGAVIDPTLNDAMRVTLIAAGMEELHTQRIEALHLEQHQQIQSATQRRMTAPATPPPFSAEPVVPPRRVERAGPATPPATSIPPSIPPTRSPSTPGRQQRSLNDLRGIRSMGIRQQTQRGQHGYQYNEDRDGPIDPPPFLRRRT